MSNSSLTQKPPRAAAQPSPLTRSRGIRWLAVLLGIVLLTQWATWLPHYLTWPWWPDLDAYATIAQGWISGAQMPYRDIVIINFPGQIEIFALLGCLGGAGRTGWFYALDALLLVCFDLMAIAWSRRRFQSVLPGLLIALVVGSYVWGQDYTLAAQRDSQGPVLALMALLCLDGRTKGWHFLVPAAWLYGTALVIRPHVILFLPAMLLAIRRGQGQSPWRPRLAWLAGMAICVLVWLLPLLDVWPDLIRGVRQVAHGSTYNQRTSGNVALAWLNQFDFRDPPRAVAPAVESVRRIADARLILLVVGLGGWFVMRLIGQRSVSCTRETWAIPACFLIALFYEPLHPKWHAYLAHPRHLAAGVLLGYLAGQWIDHGSDSSPDRKAWYAGWVVLIVLAAPGWPAFCRADRAWEACASLLRGDFLPVRVPPGAEEWFPPRRSDAAFTWSDYRTLLKYLQSSTGPEIPVANLVRNLPLPAINGPLGRRSPWPADSGIIWLYVVNPRLEPDFIQSLEAAPAGTVLVWDPDLPATIPGLEADTLRAAARRLTRLDRRIGPFEVRRKP